MTERRKNTPVTNTGRTGASVALLSSFTAPLGLLLLYSSSAAVMEAAAEGTPLSSYIGMVGILVGGLILFALGVLSTASSTALYVLTAWAGVLAIVFTVPRSVRESPFGRHWFAFDVVLAPLTWSWLPLLIFCACVGATVSVILVRRWQQEAAPLAEPTVLRDKNAQNGAISILVSLVLVAVLWITVVEQAPANLEPFALFGAQGLNMPARSGVALAISCGVVFILAVSTAHSTLGVTVGATLLMLLPGLLLIPLWGTLTGQVATPSAPAETMVALASPVMATIGATLLGTTVPIHYLRLAGWNPETQSVSQD